MAEEIGKLYITIRAELDQLKKDISDVRDYLSREGKKTERSWKFKGQFDNSIMKLRISELQALRNKLQAQFDRKLKMDVDASSLNRTRQQIQSIDNALSGVQKTGMGLGKGLLVGFLATQGIQTLIGLLRSSAQASQESIKAQMQIEQAVKQTGMAAGFTADELFKMASELQKLTGIDDDQILQDVTNQLLTFTKISGESFKRAQKAVLDLNAVIQKGELSGLSSQAIQLGKALENPITGITALSRAGVTFTEQQKAQIKVLVDSGNILEAQKIILDEIEAKYGNQAEAINKSTYGIKNFTAAWGDFLEKIGKPILMALGAIATELYKVLQIFDVSAVTFEEQKQKVTELDSKIPGLLSKYEQLASKGSLNTNEQTELNSVIKQIAELVPRAVTEFDKYGNALSINAQKVRQYVDEEKKRLAVVNKAEIQGWESQKRILEQRQKLLKSELDRMVKTGQKTITIPTAQGVQEVTIRVTDKDIKDSQKKLSDLSKEIEGVTEQINFLKGESKDFGNSITQSGVTTYVDEILNSYEEQKNKLDQIKARLKEGNLTAEERKILTNEQIKLEEELYGKIKKTSGIKNLGYSPEQIVQFEKLKFAVSEYIDYRKKLIELEYKNEVEQAKGNSDLIAEAEFNKNLKLEELKQEKVDFDKKMNEQSLKDYEDTVGKIEQENKKHLDELEKQRLDYEAKKQKAVDEYYSGLKVKDESYFDWRLQKIAEESEALLNATGNSLMAKQYEIDQMKALEEEYFNWKIDKLLQSSGGGDLLRIQLAGITNAYDTLWQTIADSTMSGSERVMKIWDSFKAGLLGTFAEILKEYITNSIKQMVVADKFKALELAKGTALGQSLALAYAPAAINASIMTFGSASAIGLASYSTALQSGIAQNILGGIPKFATGGEMVVPPGFPNDSFPALFTSGEKIKATPKGKVGEEVKLLNEVINSIRALTKTLYEKPTSPTIVANIDALRFTESEVLPNIQKVIKSGKKI